MLLFRDKCREASARVNISSFFLVPESIFPQRTFVKPMNIRQEQAILKEPRDTEIVQVNRVGRLVIKNYTAG